MAASANRSGNNEEATTKRNGAASNGISVPENSKMGPTQAALKHNPGVSGEWSPVEQSLLVELIAKYASESKIIRYAKIAKQLKDKTVRDVALRCRWMNKKEKGKRRKEEHTSARKNKDKKGKITDALVKSSSNVTNRSNGPTFAQSAISMDSDDGIPYQAIGGATGQILEQNARALDQISANLAALKIPENIDLFFQTRNNILTILNDLNDMPEIMKQMPPLPVKLNDMPEIMTQMPPLPVKLNDELATSIFQQSSLQK